MILLPGASIVIFSKRGRNHIEQRRVAERLEQTGCCPSREETRLEARAHARDVAAPGDWLSQILDHHERIERAFAEVKSAADAVAQRAAQKDLAVILTGHSNAEEAVIYPALADAGEKGHAGLAYEEQAAAKVQMALLEKLEPLSQAYFDKLEHIRGAVTHHIGIKRDITERLQRAEALLETNRALEQARDAAVAASRAKSAIPWRWSSRKPRPSPPPWPARRRTMSRNCARKTAP